MSRYEYFTVDVFTDKRFGGNPLAVFPNAEGLTGDDMQSLAAEINYSETTFVFPPKNPANTAHVRIFNRSEEMAFAGHPNVGTAYLLSRQGYNGSTYRFEELAGDVEVRLLTARGATFGAEVDAPRTLAIKQTVSRDLVAECLSINRAELMSSVHEPIVASVGFDFLLVQAEVAALARTNPDISAFRSLAGDQALTSNGLAIFVYALDGDIVRARMFAPLAGTWEDPATGAANAALAALRASLTSAATVTYEVIQGVEMGRASRLTARAWQAADGYRAAVGGACVPMFCGSVDL